MFSKLSVKKDIVFLECEINEKLKMKSVMRGQKLCHLLHFDQKSEDFNYTLIVSFTYIFSQQEYHEKLQKDVFLRYIW